MREGLERGALSELGRELLEGASSALLDSRLDTLGERFAREEAGALLTAAYEAGVARTLRELLQEPLEAWVNETCTRREEELLAELFRRWLGMGELAGDDPARLSVVPPPPREPLALRAWAEEHGVAGELARPVADVLKGLRLPADLTIEACALGLPAPRSARSLLHSDDPQREARAHLQRAAAQQRSLSAREVLWSQGLPTGKLRLLAERLWALLAAGDVRATPRVRAELVATLHALRFVPAHPVGLELETGICRARLCGDEPAGIRVRLLLSGYEQRAVMGECEACTRSPCLHVRALAARLFDAALSPDDRLHGALREFVEVPSWRRFMAALTAEAPEPDASRASERVTFSVRLAGGGASVGALLQKPLATGRWSAGKLVSAHKLLRAHAVDPRDRPVLEAMAAANRTLLAKQVPADMVLWRSLLEHPRVQLEGDDRALCIVEESVTVTLIEQPDGLLPKLSLGGAAVAPGLRAGDVSCLLQHDVASATLFVAPLTPALRRLLAALEHHRGVLPPESYGALAPWLASLRSVARVQAPKVLDGREQPPPRKLLLRITPGLAEGIDVMLSMRPLPLGALWPPGQGPELVHGFTAGEQVVTRRDLAWERGHAEDVLTALALREHMRLEDFHYRVETDQAALELLSKAARLADGLDLEWSERLRRLRIADSVRRADLKIGLFKRGEWLELAGGARTTNGDIPIGRLLEAARRGERFVRIDGQSYAEIEAELFERLERAQLCVHELTRLPKMSVAATPYWLRTLELEASALDGATAGWLERARSNAPDFDQPPPEQTGSELRQYQLAGVRWLMSRSRWAPGACLADEMGLGKTAQTISVLAARAAQGPALVVAPTSLVSNWLRELARFAPALRAHAYRGAKRHALLPALCAGAVFVTSFDVLLRDRARFEGLHLSTLVIDEAQVVKNARTLRARAVSSLSADFRIALSGTPVENRLGDLWSLFQLVAPGLLGSWARFRARFAVPIERYGNAERANALRALIAPFVLRRTKQEVLQELPARTEVVHLVELSRAEQDLYDAAARHARRAIGKRRREEERRIQLLAELTRLRQLACHPRLVLADERAESSKLHAFVQLMEDLLPRGHRALVFSQFTRHLALVREALERLGASYLYLDGSTPAGERLRLVDRFQQGEAQLFLISLKAGGTGLNLTAADYVIHMDPWWNPAAEDQASDRAHRLGQQRPVTVIKLVAQGTIEERVLGLHGHKRKLAESVLAGSATSGELDLAALEALLALA